MTETELVVEQRPTVVLEQAVEVELVVEQRQSDVVEVVPQTQLVQEATQGPPGPPGVDAGAVEINAAVQLIAYRAVIEGPAGLVLANPFSALHAGRVLGLVENAAAPDTPGRVRSGFFENAGWSFTPEALLWLGADGALVEQVPVGAAFRQPIGTALSATRIWVQLGDPTLLGV